MNGTTAAFEAREEIRERMFRAQVDEIESRNGIYWNSGFEKVAAAADAAIRKGERSC